MLILGAMTFIALILPGQGSLTSWWTGVFAPWFGAMRWLLPFGLLAAGWYLESRQPKGWGLTLLGMAIAYAGVLGMAQILLARPAFTPGGRIGRFLEEPLEPLLTAPGAVIVLFAMVVIGVMLAFNLRLAQLTAPITAVLAWLRATTSEAVKRDPATPGTQTRDAASASSGRAKAPTAAAGAKGAAVAAAGSPGQTGIWGQDDEAARNAIPVAVPSAVPTSATFAPARTAGVRHRGRGRDGRGRRRSADARTAIPMTSPMPVTRRRPAIASNTSLPPTSLLDDVAIPIHAGGDDAAHAHVEEIIVRKLASFGIPAKVVGRNAGPVVTQYEVQPAPDIKVSRIEGLADDLAMALAARSLRIEAPIPGKSAVGIEIPNADFNIVALRRILEDVDFKASGSTLTFALGRDVAGKAQAVDLAKMPHLLIAGATGSGKSVMVNALITSLLCEATPDDVRMILMDLKRVELAAYNGLPHLLVPVITEPERAKAALKWAVNEMEARYRRLAGATARNIRHSTRRGWIPRTGCPTSSSSSTSSPT